MAKLIATSVERGDNSGGPRGGVYLIDLENDRILKPVDWHALDTGRQGGGSERGLRGIACHGGRIYITESDELLVFDQAFNAVTSHRNAYLENCQGICVFERHLFVASAGYDAILGFNLETEVFDWAVRIATDGRVFGARRFDPNGDEGPLLINKLGLGNVHCEKGGMYISGMHTRALLRFSGERVGVRATLPQGAHDARPYRDGILFNDTNAGAVRFERPDSSIVLPVPRLPTQQVPPVNQKGPRSMQPASGRGLCVISKSEIAAGSSPATISIYDLDASEPVKIVNLSPDPRHAIHGIEVWPYPWPDR